MMVSPLTSIRMIASSLAPVSAATSIRSRRWEDSLGHLGAALASKLPTLDAGQRVTCGR